MNSKRLYYFMLAIIVLMIAGLAGGAYGANKLLQNQSNQLVSERLQTSVLSQEQTELANAKQDIKKYQGLSDITESIVPQDKDQAQTVREIVDIANANGIALSSVTFPTSTLGIGAGGTPTSTPSSSQKLSQLIPVKGIPGVYDLQITVTSDINQPVAYSSFISFLSALEHNRRTAQVNSISIQPDETNRNTLSFTLILDEYIKP